MQSPKRRIKYTSDKGQYPTKYWCRIPHFNLRINIFQLQVRMPNASHNRQRQTYHSHNWNKQYIPNMNTSVLSYGHSSFFLSTFRLTFLLLSSILLFPTHVLSMVWLNVFKLWNAYSISDKLQEGRDVSQLGTALQGQEPTTLSLNWNYFFICACISFTHTKRHSEYSVSHFCSMKISYHTRSTFH
jgi:hypothetical protein